MPSDPTPSLANKPNQSGSVLFIILVAVALFAILSYAISTSRTSSGDSSKEQINLAVSQIESYSVSLKGAIQRLMANGCSETDLKFYHPSFEYAHDYAGQATYATPGSNRCHVFASAGGGVPYQETPALVKASTTKNYLISGVYGVMNVGISSCAKTELMMLVTVPKNVCLAYNTKNGINNPSGNAPQNTNNVSPATFYGSTLDYSNWTKFGWNGGSYGCGNTIGYNNSPPELVGKLTGCYQYTVSQYYYIYDVLLPR